MPTLRGAAGRAGLRTANAHWPSSVGAHIDDNLPQVWRAGLPDDRKLLRALATPGLLAALEKELGPYADGIDESIEGDENRMRFAVTLLTSRKPRFMTAYFASLDHNEHEYGADSPQAHAALERLDKIVGTLEAALHRLDPQGIVCVVSDHGFAPVHTDINLAGAFAKAGLWRFENGAVQGWDAVPWYVAGAADIVLREANEAALQKRVRQLPDQLAGDPANGVARVLDAQRVHALGGNPQAQFRLEFRPGFEMGTDEMGTDPAAPLRSPSHDKSMHGYDLALAEMRSTFLNLGKGIPPGRNLGDIDMRDIAPTLAQLPGIGLPGAEGKPLFGRTDKLAGSR